MLVIVLSLQLTMLREMIANLSRTGFMPELQWLRRSGFHRPINRDFDEGVQELRKILQCQP